ncbi:MAG: hypothetical protein EOO79_05325 [Oxalobacteraceae bacterium]|nr:MAG: hypothetical protein EOO79_05325 [Oxalobacteraceae bacterium]
MDAPNPETTGQKQDTRFKPGQSGNPAGRPKGARAKLAQDFVQAMHESFQSRGRQAIEAVIDEKPDQYLKVMAALCPKEFSLDEETTDALADVIMARRKRLAE